MKAQYEGQGLAVIAVHTPKGEQDKDRGHVQRAAERYNLDQPIYLDNDLSFFEALGRAYRPVFFLVDRQGAVRVRHAGMLLQDSPGAEAMEAQLRELLAERAS
jgi:hypothetical protein